MAGPWAIVACVCGLGCGITSGVLCTEWHCGVRCGAGALSATSGFEVAGMRVYKRAVTGCKWCVSQPVTWGEGGRSLGLSVSRSLGLSVLSVLSVDR